MYKTFDWCDGFWSTCTAWKYYFFRVLLDLLCLAADDDDDDDDSDVWWWEDDGRRNEFHNISHTQNLAEKKKDFKHCHARLGGFYSKFNPKSWILLRLGHHRAMMLQGNARRKRPKILRADNKKLCSPEAHFVAKIFFFHSNHIKRFQFFMML